MSCISLAAQGAGAGAAPAVVELGALGGGFFLSDEGQPYRAKAPLSQTEDEHEDGHKAAADNAADNRANVAGGLNGRRWRRRWRRRQRRIRIALGSARKSAFSNGAAIRYVREGEQSAAGEGVVADGCEAVGQQDVGQRGAVQKGLIADGGEAVG